MKTNFKPQTWFYPLAVAMIGTYDKDGNPNLMNAAWASIYDYNKVLVNMASHKTTDNLKENGYFTLAFATKKTVCESDYVGIVSGNVEKNKIKKCGLTPKKGTINAPYFDEYPLTLELKLESMDDDYHVIGEIVNIIVDDSILTDGKIDPKKLEAISFDPVNNKYLLLSGEGVADAFKCGLKFK